MQSPNTNKNTISAGTSTAFKMPTPFMPFPTNSETQRSPAIDNSGFKSGKSASNPAINPAQGINENKTTAIRTAGANRLKSASVAP